MKWNSQQLPVVRKAGSQIHLTASACLALSAQDDDTGITKGNTRECQVKQMGALSATLFSDLVLGQVTPAGGTFRIGVFVI